jgi:hypothetical protein
MKKKHIFSSNLFKNKDFFKILKTDHDINYLAKSVEQLFSKPHLDGSESAKTHFFVTLPKLKIMIKNVLLYRKRTRKVHLNMKGLFRYNLEKIGNRIIQFHLKFPR